MQASIPEKDYTSRRGELSAYGRAVNSSRALRRLLCIFGIFTTTLILLAIVLTPIENNGARIILLMTISSIVVGLVGVWRYTREHFIDPDLAFRKWLQQVCDGELSARIGLPSTHRHYKELNFHTRNLASSLRQLSTDMESLVDTQTQRLENQNRVLDLLFRLTADVATEIDLQSVLGTVCTHLARWLDNAQVAAYMLESKPGKTSLKLTATSCDNSLAFCQERAVTDLPDAEFTNKGLSSAQTSLSGTHEQILRIPIVKLKEVVGMVEVIVSGEQKASGKESQRVFQTVSEQLGLFVEREFALESAHNARLTRERTELGAEIHDSLAQTLLATRLHINMLRQSVDKQTNQSMYEDILHIEGMIDEANAEVRGLIGEYRKPLSEHRYADTIQKIIDDFNQTSPIEVFFQLDNPGIRFTAREDSVIDRIVTEALVNAGKYSKASMIRVYVRDEPSGARSLLIEDDGIGFDAIDQLQQTKSNAGTQIGLFIMRDRALSIGAKLTIDSEPGEGTRVFLKLPPLALLEQG